MMFMFMSCSCHVHAARARASRYCGGCDYDKTSADAKKPFSFLRGKCKGRWKLRTLQSVLKQLDHAWSLPAKQRQKYMRKNGFRIKGVKGVSE